MQRRQIHNILNNGNGAASIYGRTMTFVIVASLIPLCFKGTNFVFQLTEYICTAVFVVDYILRWSTADLKLGKGFVSFVVYPFTPMAIVDLISILPTFVALNSAWRAMRILRLFRVLRAFKLIRYSTGANAIAAVFVEQKQSLLAVLGLAAAFVLISALIVFNVEPQTFNTFFDAVYWAVVSLTTVGYGDLYPETQIGRTIAMLSSLMGIAVVALPSGIITAGLLDELREQKEKQPPEKPQ